MKFLSNVLAVIVGMFIFSVFAFFFMIMIAAIAGSSDDGNSVKNNSVIELDLGQVTLDYAGKSNYKEFDYFETGHNGLSDVIEAIKAAKTDDKIKGISILNHTSELGIAQTKALRDALEDFKASGKFVMAYSNFYTQKDYYLASVANTIYISPVGQLEFKGLTSELMFFKDLEDRSGVDVEIVRHGKYKSAVEPFLQNEMSDANREQVSALLNSVWNSVIADVSKSRNISIARLNEIASGLLARTPESAKAEKLVDKIAYEDTYHNAILKALKTGKDSDKNDDDFEPYNTVKIVDYAENIGNSAADYTTTDRIAIVYAQGELLAGEGSENYIGEGAMRRALKQAREDKNIKAVVLRIDSPGGSALTAELIWREIELTKKVKPVVVSMGNLAASGGYYIACNANEIFAEENTITGSIGVFGMLPNFTRLATKIGVHTQQVSTHDNGSEYSPFMPLTDKYRGIAQQEVERIYTTFVNRVAAGRKMTFAQVDSIGQGRVWSGADAVKIGLVDKIGGMDEAINAAAKLAKIDKYRTQDYPEYNKNLRDLLANLGVPFMSSKESIIKNEIGEDNYKLIERIKIANSRKGMQMLMPFEIEIN